MKQALIVVNPIAGGGRAAAAAPALVKALADRGVQTKIITTSPMDQDDALDQAILDSEAIIAMGGDGTLNRVARPIVLKKQREARSPAVAFVPFGTGNVAARAFRLPRNFSDVADLVALGTVRPIDVGVVSRNGMAVAVFLLWLGAGLDGALIHRVAAHRPREQGLRLILRYMIETPRTFMTYRFPAVTLQSERTHGEFAGVILANIGPLGIGNITRDADPSDGKVDIIAARPRSRPSWLLSGLLVGLNRSDLCWNVCRSRETDVRLTAKEPVPVQIDGEPFGPLPLTVEMKPAALHLLSPVRPLKSRHRCGEAVRIRLL